MPLRPRSRLPVVIGLGIRWDGTINAGHVLTATVLTLGLLVWGLRLESKVDMIDARQAVAEQRAAGDIALIRRSLERIEDRMNVRPPR